MREERAYDPKKDFYAKRSFKYAGKDYIRGVEFPSRDITNKQLLKLFQNGFVGYSEDFRDNKESMKEVQIESQKPVEEKAEEVVDESPKTYQTPRKTTRRKKSTS